MTLTRAIPDRLQTVCAARICDFDRPIPGNRSAAIHNPVVMSVMAVLAKIAELMCRVHQTVASSIPDWMSRDPKRARPRLTGLVLLAVAWSGIPSAQAQEIVCERYLSGSAVSELTREDILGLQQKLRNYGYEHGRDDGVFGPATLKALKRYCEDLSRRNARFSDRAMSFQLTELDLESLAQVNELYAALDAVEPMPDRSTLVQLLEAALKNVPEDQKPRLAEIITKTTLNDDETATVAYTVEKTFLNGLAQLVVSDKVIKTLQSLQGINYPALDLFDNALEEQFKDTGLGTQKYQGALKTRLQGLAATPHPMDELETFQWKNTRCGCVPDLTGTTYGFYPYWLEQEAGGKAPTIDFSALSRIGFFTLYLDREGLLQVHDLWKPEAHQASFIKKAHKYRTQVDIVIHIPDWFAWYETVTAYQGRMVKEIAGLVSTAPKADGITFYLGGYPDNDQHRQRFKLFLDNVRVGLEKSDRPFLLNLLLPAILKENEEIVGQFLTTLFDDTRNLEKPSGENRGDTRDPVDLMLVMLNEPTTYWKKEMRYIIEKKFKSYQRRDVLRKILPVILAPADATDQQFIDDLIYFEDNFGGIGFWPIPTGEEKNRQQLSDEVLSAFEDTEHTALMQRVLTKQSKWFCRLICPNRTLLKILFLSCFILMAVWAIASTWVCDLRRIYRRFSWYFLAVFLIDILLLFSLLTCDPVWVSRSTEIFVGLLIGLAIYMIFRQFSKMKQAEYP